MSKYINTDELRTEFWTPDDKEYSYEDICKILDEMQSADVVDVVRCKDCKHHKSDNEMNFNYCKFHGVYINTDFCADGERRESK